MSKTIGQHQASGVLLLITGFILSACGTQNTEKPTAVESKLAPQVANVGSQQLIAAAQDKQQWLSHGRDYAETRYAPLDKINNDTVSGLSLAWSVDLDIDRGTEATPLLVDGVLYTTGAFSMVYAIDARSGKMLWKYDPKVPKAVAGRGCCGPVNRGVAVWQGKLFLGAYDGRLIALDAKSGKPLWSVMTVDPERNYTVTGAPRIIDGKVIIGNGGAELGVRGYVSAYAADDGKMLWRFYTVPGDPALGEESAALEMARKTWHGDAYYSQGGGGTVWDSMAYDPDLDLLYIGVGNGSPWNIKYRSEGKGDNLFLSSIVALRPDNGEYVWHHQTTPGDSWDYTATQHIILADMEIEGKERKVLMQAPKNGFFYVLDRESGEFISANNYVPMNWADGVDKDGRPQFSETADYSQTPQMITPGPIGGHNWHPMSYNPNTGLVYIPAIVTANLYADGAAPAVALNLWNVGTAPMDLPDDPATLAAIGQTTKGMLLAWDPVKQEAAWSQDHVSPWNGGTLSTAGNLVFQGTADGRFVAYAADSGETLWQSKTNSGVVAAPISYELDGEQYVTVMAGWGGVYAIAFASALQPQIRIPTEARVLTYKLGGKAALPVAKSRAVELPTAPKVHVDDAALAVGKQLYHGFCAVCHGVSGIASAMVPDLRYMNEQTRKDFYAIVSGSRAAEGMPPFGHLVTPEYSVLIEQYLASLTIQLSAAAKAP
ncbi:MAG: PQQ-dependent dehydrogenase, methanol/ethanol family [Oceanococcus sp.]